MYGLVPNMACGQAGRVKCDHCTGYAGYAKAEALHSRTLHFSLYRFFMTVDHGHGHGRLRSIDVFTMYSTLV